MKYPIAERALKKWTRERLDKLESPESSTHYRFQMDGSTCSNGGLEFKAYLHAEISGFPRYEINKAWIEIPEEEQVSAAHMCSCPNRNPEEADSFFNAFQKETSFTGKPLEEAILLDVPLNHAGCLCYKPMIDQKWKMALSTMHYHMDTESEEETS